MHEPEENPASIEGKCNGRVTLIGAGPGDPGLITVAGLARLREADVVIYDALANPRLLDEAPASAIRIDAGKRAREHRLTQDQTNALLVEHARAGRRVVRLKGGDPYLFGRGAEEAIHCGRHGVTCEVIAGVTAGIAAPAAAGIPVTYRELASTVTFVTGHEDPSKDETAIDYAALAALIRAGGTACFYMGVGRLAAIAAALASRGLASTTPVAAVQWGTTPRQRTVRSTLARAVEDVAAARLGPPAIIVVGAVAGVDDPALQHFTRRPLFGQTVIITRTRSQNSELRAALESQGAAVIEAPTIEVIASDEPIDLDAAGRADWLILTSANAAGVLADALAAARKDGRALAGPRLAVVGEATAAALFERLRLRADFMPETSNGPALALQLSRHDDLRGRRCLLLRGDLASEELPVRLRDAGALVDDRVVYRTRPVAALPPEVLDRLDQRSVQWVTFTSTSTVRNFVALLGDRRGLLEQVRLASIGPQTTAAAESLGLRMAVQAATPSVQSLVDAISSA